jgi:hypothetical protein
MIWYALDEASMLIGIEKRFRRRRRAGSKAVVCLFKDYAASKKKWIWSLNCLVNTHGIRLLRRMKDIIQSK